MGRKTLGKLSLQKFSLVQATNSNNKGDQSPFNLLIFSVAFNLQPSSTVTMQEVTHVNAVPYVTNINLS